MALTAAKQAQIRSEYIDWLLLSSEQRTKLGLPDSIRKFSDWKECGERTLRRWNGLPEFQAEVEERRAAVLAAATPGAASGQAPLAVQRPVDKPMGYAELLAQPAGDSMEATFSFAWAKLQALIAQDDKAALQMFMNSPLAKSVMEAQLEQKKSDFSDLTDEDLAARLLSSCTDVELAEALKGRGWTVVEPA